MSGLAFTSETFDLHCHGGGGFYFSDPSPENIQSAIEFHKMNGTGQLLASLVTEDISTLKQQIRRLIPFCENNSILGIHLEGPYLAQTRCGAHNPTLLRTPNLDEIKSLIDEGQGNIRMITIAPELDGALVALKYLRSIGIVAAIGHSAGTYEDAFKATDAGAQLVTHFSNGMSKLVDGDKTFATALLYERDIYLELIVDHEHVSDADVRVIAKNAESRLIFVTDAMSAAGQPDGEYKIGSLEVRVSNGVARLATNNSLAGSTLTMKKITENASRVGIDNQTIVKSVSENPKRLLGF